MKYLLKGALIALCFFQSLPVMAGSSSARSSFKSSAGYAARSPAYRSSFTGSTPYKSFRPADGSSTATGRIDSTSPGSKLSPSAPQSLQNRSGPQPSPQLQTIIREKEASGPGWVGTAGLIWLLSQHDLSASDREWINNRLREENSGNTPPVTEQSDVSFQWSIPATFTNGQPAKIVIAAVRHGKVLLPDCELGNIKSVHENNAALLNWTPEHTVSAVATCRADGWVDQRLLAVSQPRVEPR
ncbi:hypothetical protein [Pantoea vagans]|uniref:hypothetical protein n=1 Tax=Pantoea vagans TaxID=470934 RepID=UPI0023AF1019|nr:hypothetical protein [Pantoea vagans]MDE8558883.1 hypothetical protein [Pantoea vagans]MDE8578888.1 hypothetical protein [Pantoea vagans]